MKGEHRRTGVVWGQKYSVPPCHPAGKDKHSTRLTWRCSAGARWPAGAELGWVWRRLPCCSWCQPLLPCSRGCIVWEEEELCTDRIFLCFRSYCLSITSWFCAH